jgi:hypothetical protein
LRPLVWVWRTSVELACIGVLGWMALATYFDLAPGATPWFRAGLARIREGLPRMSP